MNKLINILNKIPNNHTTVIHSNLLCLGKKTLKHNKDDILKIIQNHFKKKIFLPCFNLTKKKIVNFDNYETTNKGLTTLAIKKKDFKRTLNPTHSYITNYNKIDLEKFKRNSFGKNSIFDFFLKKNFLWVSLGCGANDGFTILHHFEKKFNVHYRKVINREKIIISNEKRRDLKISYFARKSRIKNNFNNLIETLIKNKIIKQFKVNNYSICYFILDRNFEETIKSLYKENKKIFLI